MKTKDFYVDVTKRTLHHEQCNDMCHNYYWLVYVRIYNANRTRYRKAKFIVLVDAEDVCMHVDADTYTDADVRGLADELIGSVVDMINSYDDTCDFYDFCSQSINRFNAIVA